MSVTAPPGRTHLYYTGEPEFAFGTGLSYSEWSLALLGAGPRVLRATAAGLGAVGFAVNVTNAGPFRGRQRVLAFAAHPPGPPTRPRQVLWAYSGTELGPGRSAVLRFSLRPRDLARSDERGDRVLVPGEYGVRFSDGARDVRARVRVTDGAVVERDVLGLAMGRARGL
eukprot:gene3905-31199_t